jgi:hypothetical protein
MRFASSLACAFAALLPNHAVAKTLVTDLVVWTSSNVGGSGTDSNIYVKLLGTDGSSTRVRLQDFRDGNILENGAKEYYGIGAEVGTAALAIEVESDGLYSGSDWHLDRIYAITYDKDLFTEQVIAMTMAMAQRKAFVAPNMTIVQSALTADGRAPANIYGVTVSTFTWENWVNGDEIRQEAGIQKKGIVLSRKEPPVIAVGTGEQRPMPVYVVYRADALDSGSPATRTLDTTITTTETLTLSSETSNEAAFGLSVTAGYAAGEDGGWEGSATLSAEYKYVASTIEEKSFETGTETSTSDTFSAEPGTIQFRILSATGVVNEQTYRSLLQDRTFKGLYVRNVSPFQPTEATFEKGTPGEDKWVRTVAGPYAVAVGKLAYDSTVSRLRTFGILAWAPSYDEALALAK